MAVVAVATIHVACFVCPCQAATALGDFFALFPVTDELAVRGPLDGFQIHLFNGFGRFFVQWLARHIGITAGTVGLVGGRDAFDFHMTLVTERSFHDFVCQRVQLSQGRTGCATCGHQSGSHAGQNELGLFVHEGLLFQRLMAGATEAAPLAFTPK
jgi:hypothetical protein